MSRPVSPPPAHAALGNVRAFVTVLVVLHHVVLAYNIGLPGQASGLLAQPQWWRAVPVMSTERSIVWTLVTGLNDVYFMALMFFLSGLFVWPSLERRGVFSFLGGRVHRLGWGFAVGAALLAPLAYYPTFALAGGHGIGEYARVWMRLGDWPAGPAWFLWMLLAFDAVAAIGFARLRGVLPGHASRPDPFTRPVVAFAWIALASCAAYVSMLSLVGPLHWTTVGPFTFQTSRLLHYAVYFAAGVLVGARGIDGSWLAEGGALARRAPWWTAAAIAAFLVLTVLVVITPATAPTWQSLATGVVFALSCAASSFALLSLFLRAGRSQSLAWRGLRDAAYGIYLVHFAIAAWVQYALVGWSADALVKGAIAFAVTLALSWMLASAVRRIPGFASVL